MRNEMITGDTNPYGSIEVSPTALATIASQAVLRSYGVVGMAPKNVVDELANIIVPDPRHGVDVIVGTDSITINLHIIVEYGTRISMVAESVADNVRFNLERALGVAIGEINVYVHGLRVSNPEA
jgi:uncharacterized alkaline shock family protein YloU